jgi:glycosyltransferase involved in cell wall biosynthesis
MKNKNTISVVLPIKSGKAIGFQDFFERCIQSVKNQGEYVNELVIVHGAEEYLTNFLNEFDFSDLNVVNIQNDGESDFASQMNLGIKSSSSKWVCFFEFDDEFSGIWLKNLKKYSEAYPEVESFLPIVIDVDSKNTFAGFTNEATFAANFAQEIGYLTNEMLHNYQNFQSAGMAIKKSVLDEFEIGRAHV